MKKIYFLSTCSTSKKIIEYLNLKAFEFEFQDIKFEPITAEQLKVMKHMSGSYESLFSKRARKYKELDLSHKYLTEADFKHFILAEYTFLKRPVILINNAIFVGNSKDIVEKAAEKLKLIPF